MYIQRHWNHHWSTIIKSERVHHDDIESLHSPPRPWPLKKGPNVTPVRKSGFLQTTQARLGNCVPLTSISFAKSGYHFPAMIWSKPEKNEDFFFYMGVSINARTLKWMVYNGKKPLKWMILGYPYFRKPPYLLFGLANSSPLIIVLTPSYQAPRVIENPPCPMNPSCSWILTITNIWYLRVSDKSRGMFSGQKLVKFQPTKSPGRKKCLQVMTTGWWLRVPWSFGWWLGLSHGQLVWVD